MYLMISNKQHTETHLKKLRRARKQNTKQHRSSVRLSGSIFGGDTADCGYSRWHLEHLECSHQPHTQGRGAKKRTQRAGRLASGCRLEP